MKSRIALALLSFSLMTAPCLGAESLSYSGRLVNSNGSPVQGPVDLKFELAYSGNTAVIHCSQDISGVALTNGVFHAKLDLTCGTSLSEVLSTVPTGQEAVIRVTNTSATPDKVYSFQALHSVPSAQVAHGLAKLNANNNEVLTWTGSKWEPKPVTAGGAGTVTSVASGTGLVGGTITNSGTLSVDVGTSAGKIPQLDGSGKLATSVETDPTVQGFAKSALPTCTAGQVLKSNGTVFSCVADVDTDTTLVADGTTLSTSGLTISVKAEGILDTHLSGISSSCGINQVLVTNGLGSFSCANKQWAESLGNLSFATGSVAIGGSSPASSAILDLQSTTKGFLPPRMTTGQKTAIASPSEGLIVFDTTLEKLSIYSNGTWNNLHVESEVSFSVNRAANQTLTTSTDTQVDWTAEVYDTAAAFDLTSNRFTPTKAGRYLVVFNAACTGMLANEWCIVSIRKNGTIIVASDSTYANINGSTMNNSVSVLLNMNGTTDYVDTVVNSNGASPTLVGGVSNFTGFLINGAYAEGSGGGGSLTADSVNSSHIVDNSVTLDDLNFANSDGIQFPQLGANPGSGVAGQLYYNTTSNSFVFHNGSSWQAVGGGSVSANAVDSSKIADGSITGSDIANATITLDKLNGTSDSTKYLRGDKAWATFLTDVLASSFATVTPSNTAIANGDSLQTVVNKTQGQINNLVSNSGNYLVKNGTDSITGTLTVNPATGSIKIPSTPSGGDLTDAANVQYVNNYVDTFGQWTKSGSDIYRTSGNVGIGTNTPASTFSIANRIQLDRGLGNIANGSDIWFAAQGLIAAESHLYFNSGANGGGNGDFIFSTGSDTSSATPLMTIKTNGNVGIGTSAPSQKLTVSGSQNIIGGNLGINNAATTDSMAQVTLQNDAQTFSLAVSGTAGDIFGIYDNTAASYRLSVAPGTGNIGVGTVTPSAKLEVAGQVKITGGTPGVGKVLTSDATGLASWGNPATYLAGTGLTLTGSTFSVNLSAAEIPNLDAAKITTGVLAAARLPATTSYLGSTIESAEITDGTIAAADIATGAVGSAQVADNSLTATDLAANSVGTSEIAAGAVTSAKTGAVMVVCSSFGGGSCIKYVGIDIAVCPAGTYPVSGGGNCPSPYFLRISSFTSTVVDDAAGWGVRCENSTGVYAEADEVKVLCMKY